jgi:hypothetical protein
VRAEWSSPNTNARCLEAGRKPFFTYGISSGGLEPSTYGVFSSLSTILGVPQRLPGNFEFLGFL